MKKVLTVMFGVVLISGFAGTFYYLYSKSKTTPVEYATETAAVADIVKKTVATGSVVPRKEVEIKPQVSGIIDKVFVEAGATIKKGDLIARIRIIPDMVSLNDAENRMSRARISFDNARRDVERNRKLHGEGAVSDSVMQQFELSYENAQQELKAAIDHLALIKKGSTESAGSASNTLVRATIEGMVLEVPLEEGDSVIEANTFNEGTTIATIADMEELIFEGKVDESEVGKIRPGMQLLLTIGALEDTQFRATLEHIAPKGIEENGAIQFEIRAALQLQEDLFVRANLSANADIVLDKRDQVLAINESLLQFDGDTPYVEIEGEPQVFERRDIEVGLSDGIQIEVVSGLSEEDKIKNPNAAAQRAS